MGGAATSKAREGAEQLKNKALERVGDVRERAYSQREQIADRVRRVSSAVRSAGDQLREQDERAAQLADMASQRIDRAAQYVSTLEPQQMVRDVESFARRQPAAFFGGAFLLGLAAARFLKSSQQVASPDMDLSRDFFEDDERFARSYSGSSEGVTGASSWESSQRVPEASMPGAQPGVSVSPNIDVGARNDGGSAGYSGQGNWPERKG